MPDEVIIADDGSDDLTKQVVEYFNRSLPCKVKHVWQEDFGFRLAEIRNKAILASESDYLVFIDGDMILDRHFISDHLKFCRPNHFLTGSRVFVNQIMTSKLLSGNSLRFCFFYPGFRNRLNGIRSESLSEWFCHHDDKFMNVRGCNMSFWKRDLFAVNGFNQEYTGWGREDSDLVVRLLNSGRLRIKLKFAAVQYHLYHQVRVNQHLDHNHRILLATVAGKTILAKVGLSSLKNNPDL